MVEAFDVSQAIADSASFASEFKLPVPNVTIVQVAGSASPDTTGWHTEDTIDIDMVITAAPNAKIIILEAQNAQSSSLLAAVAAAPKNSCNIVSMSYGGPAAKNEVQNQGVYEVPGIAFFASSGDITGQSNYPALQPGVVAVGGTTVTTSGASINETIWDNSSKSGEGFGLSLPFPFPSYQEGFNSRGFKQSPEVTAIADPKTGVAVFTGCGQWAVIGGTSVAAPLWAGSMSLVYDGRNQNSLPTIQDVHQAIYAGLSTIENTAFRDITSGCVGTSTTNCATAGYDPVSGFGSPLVDGIVSYLTSPNAIGVNILTQFLN